MLKGSQKMIFEDERFYRRLQNMIGALPCSEECKEDILQEAFLHLRELERRNPRQTPSWYLQACKFHAQHLLASGRSIDSPKRAGKRVILPDDAELSDEILNPFQTRNGLFFSAVSAKDIEQVLGTRLSRTERRVLNFLQEGRSLRDIGTKLGISHPTVLLYRRRIARLALQLGLHPYAEKWKG